MNIDKKNLTEDKIYELINEKEDFLRKNDFKMAPLEIQAILDEITELQIASREIGMSKIKITPVLDAPLVKDHPRTAKSRLSDNRMRLF